MKLVMDFGNTFKKFALFKGNELIRLEQISNDISENPEAFAREFIEKYSPAPVKSAILSSVIDYAADFDNYLERNYHLVRITEDTPLPVVNKYAGKSTLGKDRLASAVAAHTLFPGKDVLAITAGSCIIYDFVNAEGEYQGGAISPGMNMRFKALHNFTGHLPLVQDDDSNKLIGSTTKESILSGVVNGMAAEMDGTIDRYTENYENLTVILSGGDGKRFDKKLKNSIFAVPNLVLNGLNIILDFNEKK